MAYTVNQIAKYCHNINRLYRISHGQPDMYGDWGKAPEKIKQSAIDGVKFRLANSEVGSEDMHQNWVKFKTEVGWTFGPELDPVKKEHPCLRPYNELPVHEQIKDALFIETVKALSQGDY